MICTVDVDIQAANPEFPLKEWRAFKDSPTSIRIRNVPRKVGAWEINAVRVKCVYPDNAAHEVAAVLSGCVWVATIPATAAVGCVDGGYSIEADGTDERGNAVTGYRLGEGKVTIYDVAVSAHAAEGVEFMRIVDAKAENPHKGDFAMNTMELYDGATWRPLAEPFDYNTVRKNAQTGSNHAKLTNNPHAVTAAQVGAVPLVEDEKGKKTAVTIGSRVSGTPVGEGSLANGSGVIAYGVGSHAEGMNTVTAGKFSHTDGVNTFAKADYSYAGGVLAETKIGDDYAYAWNGDGTIQLYSSHGSGTFNINPYGGLDGFFIGEQTLYAILTNKADLSMISATNTTFSSAVLAVGLNIDTNSVAVLNDIAQTFGGFPLGAGETATTVGGLLAALAAAIAWLKKNKVQTLKLEDNSVETSADGGVAKLDDFFTESNSLLNGRLAYSRNATGLKDRAFNTLSFDGTEFNLSTALEEVTPTASGQPRDLLIVATATAATTISFTAGTIKGDKPTIDGSGTWLITLTEYAANTWYCRQIKMEDAA